MLRIQGTVKVIMGGNGEREGVIYLKEVEKAIKVPGNESQ